VNIHLNPKTGPDWMLPGQQKTVLTPGQNQKRYLAGALDAHTGKLTSTFCHPIARITIGSSGSGRTSMTTSLETTVARTWSSSWPKSTATSGAEDNAESTAIPEGKLLAE